MQPTAASLPGDCRGQSSLVGYSPRGRKESDTTERPSVHSASNHSPATRGEATGPQAPRCWGAGQGVCRSCPLLASLAFPKQLKSTSFFFFFQPLPALYTWFLFFSFFLMTGSLLSFKSMCVCINRSVMAMDHDSLRPHGPQPITLLCPWDFPDKDTGVGCHFLLQEIKPGSPALQANSLTTELQRKPFKSIK